MSGSWALENISKRKKNRILRKMCLRQDRTWFCFVIMIFDKIKMQEQSSVQLVTTFFCAIISFFLSFIIVLLLLVSFPTNIVITLFISSSYQLSIGGGELKRQRLMSCLSLECSPKSSQEIRFHPATVFIQNVTVNREYVYWEQQCSMAGDGIRELVQSVKNWPALPISNICVMHESILFSPHAF